MVDQGIFVFWSHDLKKAIDSIVSCLTKNKADFDYERYNDFDDKMYKIRSSSAALSSKNKLNGDELRLNRLLSSIKVEAQKKYVIQTKYGNSLCPDNFEEINGIKIAYEVTSAKSQSALFCLSGKIAYLSKIYSNP